MTLFSATREAGLARLAAFTPHMGRAYAQGRNTDPGPDEPATVSMLSPWLRRRLLTEQEVVQSAWHAHGEMAMPFIQEVVWRSYFKGYLQQRPGIWSAYRTGLRQAENRLATQSGLRRIHHDACLGQTGLACFDAWAAQLAATGWLHNHVRMWFASIWIFTLRLPWELGAAFFLRHLLDGDPASNTLSWRWVAGLHTKGKHYVARADNIARFTNGRFHPQGELDEAPEPLTEAIDHPTMRLKPAEPLPDGPVCLLLHDDDLAFETLPIDHHRIAGIALVSTASGDSKVSEFADAAVVDTATRCGSAALRLSPSDVEAWVRAQPHIVVTPQAPVGPNAELLENLPVVQLRRAWDSAIWPHATRGFFQVKQRLPELLPSLLA